MYTMEQLQRELDKAKSEIFLRKRDGHYASLLCKVNIVWAEDAVTAYTNNLIVAIEPDFFMSLPGQTRPTVLAHELTHVMYLDIIRGTGKDWDLWQMATDYRTNVDLHNRGYSFDGLHVYMDHRYDDMPPEQIYDDLVLRRDAGTLDDLGAMWGIIDDEGNYDTHDLKIIQSPDHVDSNLIPQLEPYDINKMINAVVQSIQYQAQSPGGYGGDAALADMVSQFLQPKIRWEKELLPWLTALEGYDYNWSIPSSRIRHTYLPSLSKNNEGGLIHIAFIGDSSGSITKAQLVRINSEAHYMKKRFNPEKFTMINFDDEIRMIFEMTRQDPFNEMKVVGRGGTDLSCVRQWLIDNKPKAAVIFTDMGCDPMVPLEPKDMVPILWIIFNNPGAVVPHGKIIHISE